MIKINKATESFMRLNDIPLPDNHYYCWWCGRMMDEKITHKLGYFNEKTGKQQYELKLQFSCPSWLHSIGIFSSSDPYKNIRYSSTSPIWRDEREINAEEMKWLRNLNNRELAKAQLEFDRIEEERQADEDGNDKD